MTYIASIESIIGFSGLPIIIGILFDALCTAATMTPLPIDRILRIISLLNIITLNIFLPIQKLKLSCFTKCQNLWPNYIKDIKYFFINKKF